MYRQYWQVLDEFGVLTVIGVLIVLILQDVLEFSDFLLMYFCEVWG